MGNLIISRLISELPYHYTVVKLITSSAYLAKSMKTEFSMGLANALVLLENFLRAISTTVKLKDGSDTITMMINTALDIIRKVNTMAISPITIFKQGR